MASRPTGPASQAFYSPRLNKSANIACRFDPRRNISIILWRDVERFCPHARYATLGEDTIPFLVDDDFNDILPLRIEPYPEKVLSVVADDAPSQQPSAPNRPSTFLGGVASSTSTRPALAASSLRLLSTVTEPAQTESRPQRTIVGENAPRGEISRVSNLSLSMARPLPAPSINIGTASDSNTPTQTLYLSTTAAHIDSPSFGSQDTSMPMTRRGNPTILHSADQSSIHLKNRVKKFTKHLRESEWHEAPSPRLFIVLPATNGSGEYLFYWLCEDFSTGELIPHLTHETGIELHTPEQFFETYGEILLFGLYLFKSTKDIIMDGGRFYEQGTSFLERDLCCGRKQVESNIDRMITRLRSQIFRHAGSGSQFHSTSWTLPQYKDDLYGIRSFLSKRRFLTGMSNEEHHGLFRLVGEEGNVQWVCSSHFYNPRPFDFDPPFIQRELRQYGAYDVQRGLVTARVRSKAAAQAMSSMYDAFIRGFDCVFEFSLHLGWEATDRDLDELCSAVAGFNLVSVVVTSPDLCKRVPVIARPIKHILECGRIQSFGLGSLYENLKLFDTLLLAKRSSKLKSVRLTLNSRGWDCQAIKENVDRVINNLPTLKDLDIKWDELEQVPHLESSLRSFAAGVCHAHRVIMRGETQEVTLIVNDFMQQPTHSSLLWTYIR